MKKPIFIGGLVVTILGGGTLAVNADSLTAHADKEGLQQVKWAEDAQLTYMDAEKAALNKIDGKVLEVDMDKSSSSKLFDVVIYDGSTIKEVSVNADNGKVLHASKDDDADKKVQHLTAKKDVSEAQDDEYGFNQDKWAYQSKLTSTEAQQAALDQIPGKVLELDLDKNDGTIMYDVVIYDGSTIQEVSVDADTGEILKAAEDDDAKQKLKQIK